MGGQPGIISCLAASPQGGGLYAAGSYARGSKYSVCVVGGGGDVRIVCVRGGGGRSARHHFVFGSKSAGWRVVCCRIVCQGQ